MIFKRNKTPDKCLVYQDSEGLWRWKVVSRNGKTVYASEQGYSTKYYAMKKSAVPALHVASLKPNKTCQCTSCDGSH